MTAAYASIPHPSIAQEEEKDGNPIEITFSIQKYKIPPTDKSLTFLDENKAKFPLFNIVDGVTQYLNKLSNSDDVGFILKSKHPSSTSYARATKKPMNVVDRVQLQLPHTSVVDRVQPLPTRTHAIIDDHVQQQLPRTHVIIDDLVATLEARKHASSPFRSRRKKLSKSGKKVAKKSDKKSGKVRKNKRKTTL